MAPVLVVDDDLAVLGYFRSVVADAGHKPVCAATAGKAIDACRDERPTCGFVDLRLGAESGIDLVRDLRRDHAHFPAALISAFCPTVEEIVQLVDVGFEAFLPKPCRPGDIHRELVEMLAGTGRASVLRTARDVAGEQARDGMIGNSAAMQELHQLIDRCARVLVPVLITGETGTGKELAARAIHRRSGRTGRFVAVNCGGVPSTLFEAECFGHERGAFTDAHERKAGWFEQAHRGTLLLDEVGELAPDNQAKLLRVLQEGMVRRLGGHTDVSVDVRVIAATHVDLAERMSGGLFREDLYYRLCALSVRLRPLRERQEDLPALIDHSLAHCSLEARLPGVEITPEARALLCLHRWKGNIRELQHAVMQAVLNADGAPVRPEHLPAHIGGAPSSAAAVELPFSRPDGVALGAWLDEIGAELTRQEILRTLARHGGNRSRAAADLGMNRKTLFDKIRGLDIGISHSAERESSS